MKLKHVCTVYFVLTVEGFELVSWGLLWPMLALHIATLPLIQTIQSTSQKLLHSTCSDAITNRILHNSASFFLSRTNAYWIIMTIDLVILIRSRLHFTFRCCVVPRTFREIKDRLRLK
eukprot:TRINITY_DN8330_c0_g1_i1.p1 TRINITY_DN8330_c0_g1~~TRINITY_DN8330_c0_g1_i1.p1  ORF type:complete len:118 (-),score=4.17 TRINITY_DN8330_c0_g1_i1:148-501(-)